jgi:hypothetical protein
MGEVGCYTLTLYCDDPGHPEGEWRRVYDAQQVEEHNLQRARREARAVGWAFLRNGSLPILNGSTHGPSTICPDCAKKRKRERGGETMK